MQKMVIIGFAVLVIVIIGLAGIIILSQSPQPQKLTTTILATENTSANSLTVAKPTTTITIPNQLPQAEVFGSIELIFISSNNIGYVKLTSGDTLSGNIITINGLNATKLPQNCELILNQNNYGEFTGGLCIG